MSIKFSSSERFLFGFQPYKLKLWAGDFTGDFEPICGQIEFGAERLSSSLLFIIVSTMRLTLFDIVVGIICSN